MLSKLKKLIATKKSIIYLIILFVLSILTIVFIYKKFSLNSNNAVAFDFSKGYDKVEFSKGDIFIFNKNKISRYDKNQKLKKEKEFEISGKFKMANDVIYLLTENELIMYSADFDEIKKIQVEGIGNEFYIENDRIFIINEDGFKIYNDNLEELSKNIVAVNPIYLKFSKSKENFIYTDFLEKDNQFKTRFHILNIKENKSLYDFAFYNEFIVDVGFIDNSEESIYVITNEKLYLFDGNSIKNQYYIKNLKDIEVKDDKIYLLSDTIEIIDLKTLKLDKVVNLSEEYTNIVSLKNDIIITKSNGYTLVSKKDYSFKEFSTDVMDIVEETDGVYIISQDKYTKLK